MKKEFIQKVFVICFFFILLFFMITTVFNNEKVSLVERRELKVFPKFSVNKLLSAKYYDDLTEAFQDQLNLRSYLVRGYFLFQFQRYYGDVVKGANKQLYSPQQKVSNKYYDDLKNTLELVNKQRRSIDAKFIYLSIPRKDAYMVKDLPSTYSSSLDIYKRQVEIAMGAFGKDIIFIDALEVFESSNVYNCYYSNDHHITPRCAYLLYDEINKYTGVDSYDLEDEFELHKTIINGSYSRQLGQTVKSIPEELYVSFKKDIKYKRYENDKLSNKKVYGTGNTYEDAYMEGDTAYTRIETNKKGENIMFVGSSYTNILEALSVPSYNRVLSIDYRHNKSGNSINYYVDKYDINYVVFIPAQSNNSYSLSMIKKHLGL